MQLRKETLLDSFKFTRSPVTNINLLLILSKHNQQKKSSMSITDHQVEQEWRSRESTSTNVFLFFIFYFFFLYNSLLKQINSTNVARVQIPASTPYAGWVCFWFSSLLREVFLRVLRFSPLLKKPTFPNSNLTRNQVDEEPLCGCATCKSLFIYLFINALIF